MALSADILRGYTDTILLKCLAEGDSYGYQMVRQIAQKSGGALQLKEPTLYTAFRRLTQDGLIDSYWGDEQSGARRRYYRLTEKGLERLLSDQQAWIETRQALDRLLLDENE